MVLPLFTAPIVARELGPSDRGIYAACIASITLIPIIVGLGVPLAVRRRASVESFPEIIRTVYLLVPLLVAPSVLLAWFVRVVFVPELTQLDTIALLVTVGLSTFTVLTLSLQSVLIVKRAYLRIAALQSVQTVCITSGTILGWAVGSLSISWLIWSAAAGSVLAACTGLAVTRVSPMGNRAGARKILAEGMSFSGSQMSEVASNTLLQILAVSVIGSHDAGLFAIAMTIAGLPLVLGHTVGIVSFQHVASAKGETAIALAASAFRSSVVLGIVASVLLTVVSPLIIPFLFGSEYYGAVLMAVIVCAGGWLIVANYVGAQLLAAQRRGWAMTLGQFGGLCMAVASLYLLGPSLGGIGAAISVLLGRGCTFIFTAACLPGPKVLLLPRPRDVKPAFKLVLGGKLVV